MSYTAKDEPGGNTHLNDTVRLVLISLDAKSLVSTMNDSSNIVYVQNK
jgi:hypothetical protein